MDISDLLSLDMKDFKKIDYKKLMIDLQKRPDIIINIVVVLLSIVVSIFLLSKRQTEIGSLKEDILQMTEKVAAIDKHHATQKEIEDFTGKIPRSISEDEFVNILTDFAVQREIQIESISPARTESHPLYQLMRIDMMINVKDYATLWIFINDLEKASHLLRIDDLDAYMTSKTASDWRGDKNKQASILRIRLGLSTVKIL